jgi:hypothetical protein
LSVPTTAFRVWVECIPTATDDEKPIRLVLASVEGKSLARMKFSPQQAWDSATVLNRLLTRLVSPTSARRLAEEMRTAAIWVWSTRN